MATVSCQMCLREFLANTEKAKYCPECRKLRAKEQQAAYYRRKGSKGKAVKKSALSEIAEKASAEGISYGKYVAKYGV